MKKESLGRCPEKESLGEMLIRHHEEIEELQANCKHNGGATDWQNTYWAPGHSSTFLVKECRHCGAEVNRKVSCHGCGKEMVDYKWNKGDGSSFKCLSNTPYCDDCWRPAKRLTNELRDEIQGITFGEFVPNSKVGTHAFFGVKNLFTIGDVTTEKVLGSDNCVLIRLAIVDGKSQRGKKKYSHKVYDEGSNKSVWSERLVFDDEMERCANPLNAPGTISADLEDAIDDALKSRKKNLVMYVNGEEDLAFIPLALKAPLGSVICYGQPPMNDSGVKKQGGMIVCMVSKEMKAKVQEIYDRMVMQGCECGDEVK